MKIKDCLTTLKLKIINHDTVRMFSLTLMTSFHFFIFASFRSDLEIQYIIGFFGCIIVPVCSQYLENYLIYKLNVAL